jgi:hypothetical protein
MDEWQNDPANKKLSKAGDDRTPAWRWTGYLYHDGQTIGIPADNIRRCLMDGGVEVKVPGGKGSKTFKAQTQSGILIVEPYWPLTVDGSVLSMDPINDLMNCKSFAEHKQITSSLGFSLFVKRAKVGQSKHIRVRPRFNTWKTSGTVRVVDEQITTRVLTDMLTYAGLYKGLCDWRPGSPKSPGPWGMFTATVKEVKPS